MTRHDLTVDAVLIVGTVGGERRDLAIYLVEQRPNLRGVIDIAGGQRRRHDLSGVSVHGDVQLTLGPPGFVPCFSSSHSPEPQSFSPVLSTSRCTGPEPGRG